MGMEGVLSENDGNGLFFYHREIDILILIT